MHKYLLQLRVNHQTLHCEYWHYHRLHWQHHITSRTEFDQTEWPQPPRWLPLRWQLICDDSLCCRWRLNIDQPLNDQALLEYACLHAKQYITNDLSNYLIDVVRLPSEHQATTAWLVICDKTHIDWCYAPLIKRFGKPRAILLNSAVQCTSVVDTLKLSDAIVLHSSTQQATAARVIQGELNDIFPSNGQQAFQLALQQCLQWQRSHISRPIWLITENLDSFSEQADAAERIPNLRWWQLIPKRHEIH